ncbi:serine O-acetyltransferase [Neptunomonas japonica]|uniref:serine O-acetyltransferase n=1 Tax=Neptunomonas japonica TaxID=417574 RepID=UPI00048C2192|nr:serine acetyltransferase [Neptunomonas japonica]
MNAIVFYRLANFFYKKNIPLLPLIIKYFTFFVFNSVVPASCSIGKGSRFMYGGIGVVIHKNAVIGENVAIGQGITIGRKLCNGAPKIGNNVYIAAGSRILGNITIGDNCIIGANSVVIHDVPSNSVVGGIPGKVLKTVDKDIYLITGSIL